MFKPTGHSSQYQNDPTVQKRSQEMNRYVSDIRQTYATDIKTPKPSAVLPGPIKRSKPASLGQPGQTGSFGQAPKGIGGHASLPTM